MLSRLFSLPVYSVSRLKQTGSWIDIKRIFPVYIYSSVGDLLHLLPLTNKAFHISQEKLCVGHMEKYICCIKMLSSSEDNGFFCQ